MKKIWLISAVLLSQAVFAFAQDTDLSIRSYAIVTNQNNLSGPSSNVAKKRDLTDSDLKQFSNQTRANFYSDFGYIPISTWEITDQFDKISFMKNNILYTAYYDSNGELVGTISSVTDADLPAHALLDINKKYKGYTVGNIVFYYDNESNQTDMMYYGQQFDTEDKYFVELQNDKEKIVVQVNTVGEVSFFRTLK
jgi:hypothetical protein